LQAIIETADEPVAQYPKYNTKTSFMLSKMRYRTLKSGVMQQDLMLLCF